MQRELAEHCRMRKAEMQRKQSAERTADHAVLLAPGLRAIVAIDERLDLVDEHLPVTIGQSAGIVRCVARGRVLVDAFASGIADGDNESVARRRRHASVRAPVVSTPHCTPNGDMGYSSNTFCPSCR